MDGDLKSDGDLRGGPSDPTWGMLPHSPVAAGAMMRTRLISCKLCAMDHNSLDVAYEPGL